MINKKKMAMSQQQSPPPAARFVCQVCAVTCVSKFNLYRHLRTVHRVTTGADTTSSDASSATGAHRHHQCGLCGKTFTTKFNRDRHERYVHTSWRRFMCKNCGRDFKTKASLMRHVWTQHMFTTNNTTQPRSRRPPPPRRFQCDECGQWLSTAWNLRQHERRHETQRQYPHGCTYASFATHRAGPYDLPCTVRCQRPDQLERHIQRCHTHDGLAQRLRTEQQMADLFREQGWAFDRDAANVVTHRQCPSLRKYFAGVFSKPDFHLLDFQIATQAFVLVGNDEFAHRRYTCELDRMIKIYSAVSQCPGWETRAMVYVRFNPHFFHVNGVLHDPSLAERHAALMAWLTALYQGHVRLRHPHGLNVVYMYYDRDDQDRLCHLQDDRVPEEDREFAMVVRDCLLVTNIHHTPTQIKEHT